MSTKNLGIILSDKELQFEREMDTLCKTIVGSKAEVLQIPNFLVNLANNFSSGFEATWNIQDRFTFFNAISNSNVLPQSKTYVAKLFRIQFTKAYSYKDYLSDYLDLILLELQKLHKSN